MIYYVCFVDLIQTFGTMRPVHDRMRYKIAGQIWSKYCKKLHIGQNAPTFFSIWKMISVTKFKYIWTRFNILLSRSIRVQITILFSLKSKIYTIYIFRHSIALLVFAGDPAKSLEQYYPPPHEPDRVSKIKIKGIFVIGTDERCVGKSEGEICGPSIR